MLFRSNCINIIRCIPQLQYDEKNPNDTSREPHEITHGPDAIRGFCIERTKATHIPTEQELEKEYFREKRRKETVEAIGGCAATSSFIMYGG